MRIALAGALDLNEVSGIPRLIGFLSQALSGLGHQVAICGAAGGRRGPVAFIPVERLDPGQQDVVHTFGSFGLPELFRRRTPGTVHTYLGTIISLGLSFPPTFANLRARWFRAGIAREFASGRRAAQVTAVSRFARESAHRWYGVDRRRITVVPNGCAPARPDRVAAARVRQRLLLDPGTIHWLFIGRTEDPIKNYRLAERSFLRFRAKFPRGRLLVVTAEQRRWPDGVSGTGSLADDELAQLYQLVDGFLNCSYYDGMPLTLLEAMAAGLPALATAAGGSEDVITTGSNGYLIPRDEETIAGLMLKLSMDPELRRGIGTAARLTAERHTWGRIAEQYCEVYRKALQGSAA
ncbi:MAG: glycosyltransferase family 4 protein [Candidatus Edwardsbacteria bacterium]|jgi:glycosyltransferase involved in cell wall biosynthesis|nr:glycosyltransferase family 4 protein [Candidatus Edwardsbacteria bacterium]